MRAIVIVLISLTLIPIAASASFWDRVSLEGTFAWRSLDGTSTKKGRTFDISQPTSSGISAIEYAVGEVELTIPQSNPWGYNLESTENWGMGGGAGYRLGEDWTLMLSCLAYFLSGNNRYRENWAATASGFQPTIHGTYVADNNLHMYDIELMIEYDLKFSGLFATAGRKFILVGRNYRSEITIMNGLQVVDSRVEEFDQWYMHLSWSAGLGIARPLRSVGQIVILANYTLRQYTAGWTLRTAIRFTI